VEEEFQNREGKAKGPDEIRQGKQAGSLILKHKAGTVL